MFKAADPTEVGLDTYDLQRALDKTKSRAFLDKNAAFLGPLLSGLKFSWSMELPTAATSGTDLIWNPVWFASLLPETRETVLMHELWHVAWLHIPRCGDRDPEVWNWAADIVINNGLEDEGYSFKGVENCWKDQTYKGMAVEEVYDLLMKQCAKAPKGGSWGTGNGDLIEDPSGNPKASIQSQINVVVQAIQAAKLAGKPGSIPGEVELMVNEFLSPKIDWKSALYGFFTALSKQDWTWKRPSRRYSDIYMPSRHGDGRLEQLNYYLDVSGSVTDPFIIRFNSEVKYIKETFNPKKLKLILFDTRITAEYEFKEEDAFEKIVIVGRGGTSLVPVREHIMADNPTAAIIFSDLEVTPMESVPVPVIWVSVNNTKAHVNCGKVIHIKE